MQETTTAKSRVHEMLLDSFGGTIRDLIEDDDIVEIYVNPSGELWGDRLSSGRYNTGEILSPYDSERIIRILASRIDDVATKDAPLVSAELPISGARFEGMLPPIVEKPTFNIRKKALLVFTLEDYIEAGIISESSAEYLKTAIENKKNILVVGGTGSGKTTFSNAILREIGKHGDRLIIIEDRSELQCLAKDHVAMRTKKDVCTMDDLLKSSLRMRPDRIIVGEVRGGEALTFLKILNTGHPGGLCTIHADSSEKALYRMEQLIQEAIIGVPRELIADSIDVIVFLKKIKTNRKVLEIAECTGFENNRYTLNYILKEDTI